MATTIGGSILAKALKLFDQSSFVLNRDEWDRFS
jgi:hypothetical protein